ncbi:PREDICTED: S-phase kinase-associated protein 1 [Drosophila arizonae]|uniref:S-phase kinase-associated protein 1 n=1 Tax=Drosophila arizonae TaxID=7263 RepID=A0ABM1PU08_DROAR|nr:PREDICTED: S-phase kinase-associated protein 1 [Drosophila arizonae]
MNRVPLETRDGFLIRIDFALLRRSKVMQEMCQHSAGDGPQQELMVALDHDILLKILLWMEFHKDDEEPEWVKMKEEPADLERHICDWDKEFLRDKLSTVRAIMRGADYLDIPWLVKLCARKLRLRGPPELYMLALSAISPID